MGENMASIAEDLAAAADGLCFAAPVAYTYNPLVYARRAHADYLRRYGAGRKEVVLLGMNPGPWGMAQTGVPFGEVSFVRDWLEVKGRIDKPAPEHPARPIEGWNCRRSEVSGARLWGWAKARFDTPQAFFERFFVVNYCPLIFLEATGRNRTPDKLPVCEREPMEAACDRALRRTIERLKPQWVIGVGGFAERRAIAALHGLEVRIGRMPHPSPASPAANRGWAALADKAFRELCIPIPHPISQASPSN